MTTFDEGPLSDAAIAHKKGITVQQGRAMRDNPAAALEGSAGAYLNHFVNHPFDMVRVDDGSDGKLWDFALDGGFSSMSTDALDPRYQYILRMFGIRSSYGVTILYVEYMDSGDNVLASENISLPSSGEPVVNAGPFEVFAGGIDGYDADPDDRGSVVDYIRLRTVADEVGQGRIYLYRRLPAYVV